MPTMPLNQLAFLSEGRILANDEIGSRMSSCSSIKRVSPFRPSVRLKRSSPATRRASLQAVWLEPYCTFSSVQHQPHRVSQISLVLGRGFREKMEKHSCSAPR